MFGAQREASVQELLGVGRLESESACDGLALAAVGEGEKDLAAGGVGHSSTGGFDGMGDASGGAVFDDCWHTSSQTPATATCRSQAGFRGAHCPEFEAHRDSAAPPQRHTVFLRACRPAAGSPGRGAAWWAELPTTPGFEGGCSIFTLQLDEV